MSLCKKAIVISLLTITICSGCLLKRKDDDDPPVSEINLLSLLAFEMPGWEGEKPEIITEANDLEEYMGRSAELYSAYNFRNLAIRKYKNEKSLPITIEVAEFDKSRNAYGIYSFDAVGDKLNIGQDSVFTHGILKFWKDRILVKVIAEEDYQELEKDIIAFGNEVDSRITTIGSKPNIISLIPDEKLIPDSLHFFHKNVCLNNIYYIPESDSLHLSEQTDAVTAQYALGGNQFPRLILIKYPDDFVANTAFEGFSASYFQSQIPVLKDEKISVFKTEEDEYNSIILNKHYLILVFAARSQDACTQLSNATLAKIESSKSDKR